MSEGDVAASGGPTDRHLVLTLVNKRGLHARAAARFVRELEFFRANVTVSRDGQTVDGRSIMGLLMLGAACGSTIEVALTGTEADAAAAALSNLVASGFGEAE